MNILVIAAHPDDEVYGLGGTIAKYSEEGHNVSVLIVTDGSSTQYAGDINKIEEKKKEAICANQILGVTEVLFGDLPDMKLDSIEHVKINKVIEDTIKKVKPEIVFTHHYGDVNKDHKLIYESTLVATRPVNGQCVKKLLSYQVPSSTEWAGPFVGEQFVGNYYVEIEDYLEKKEKAILAYNTEIRDFPHPRSIEYINTLDKMVGLKVGCKSSEVFQLIRNIEK